MQGRLSPVVGSMIQAFPQVSWRDEFSLAAENGFGLMEWTLDHEGLDDNPLMTSAGRNDIRELSEVNSVRIPSVTGDCFMQAPFWKAERESRNGLEDEFLRIVESASDLGIEILMVPLVDGGAIESDDQESRLVDFLLQHSELFASHGVSVALESDFAPKRLRALIERLPVPSFGINYDIGNSAALGYDPGEEIGLYGDRIINLHVKDRLLGGTTVPLGTGAADIPLALGLLADSGYDGDFILQTARAEDGDDVGALCHYRDMTLDWLEHRGS